jgi:hypothetical protein
MRNRALSLIALASLCAVCNSPSASDGTGALNAEDVIFLALSEQPNAHMDALFDGTVAIDEAGCIRLQNVERSTVVWPYGATLDDTGTELRVRDASGRVLGRIGGAFRFGGGHVPELHDGMDLTQAQRDRARASCPGPLLHP